MDTSVKDGARCDPGSFKAGTMTQIEKTLTTMLPDSRLRANPHIDSKMRLWKKEYGILYDMLNVSGFGWNDIKKCVEVDSNDVWEVYVQTHKDAEGWRDKSFLLYERLANIFVIQNVFQQSCNEMKTLATNIFNKNEDRSDIAYELATMGFDIDKELDVRTLILDKPSNISAFISLKGERRLAFVEKLLRDKATS
ncbi:hypothetical protein QYF36_003714 [Acer negundo]|nr:hypothetical protein QYF36_003714 [Acer negundo]